MNYFEFFSLPTQYNINNIELEKKYLTIQQQAHPDKLLNKTQNERILALNHSADANHAYTTLKDPLLRAKYLLSLNNINIDQEIRHSIPKEILQQSFFDRENLEETNNIDHLKTLLDHQKQETHKVQEALELDFKENNLKQAVLNTINLQYKTKLLHEIKDKIKKLR